MRALLSPAVCSEATPADCGPADCVNAADAATCAAQWSITLSVL